MANITPESVKPGTLRRRARKAKLAAGQITSTNHGNAYWARNWGCECLTCKAAVRKLNHEQYIARKARKLSLRGE